MRTHRTPSAASLSLAAVAIAVFTIVALTLSRDARPAYAATASNATPITIPASSTVGPAAPYPSDINYANTGETIVSMTVTLSGLTSTFPGDLDVLLVGPTGVSVIIMSDAGGGTDVAGVNLTIDDAAAGPMPSPLSSGSYQVTNIGIGDTFAGAPAPGAGTALSEFAGTDPAGTWSLYIVDDAAQDVHSLSGGWSIDITATGGSTPTATPTATGSPSVSTPTGSPTTETAPRTHTPTPDTEPTELTEPTSEASATPPPANTPLPAATAPGGGVAPISPPNTGSGGYRSGRG